MKNMRSAIMLPCPDDELRALARLVKSRGGPDLMAMKPRLFVRRLKARMRANGCETIAGYAKTVAGDLEESERLLETLAINVSGFFRNPEMFRKLAQDGLRKMARKSRGEILAVSAGAARGEELYSLGMLIAESAGKRPFRLVGIDMNPKALESAARAVYLEREVVSVPGPLLKKYFRRVGQGRQIKRSLRTRASFVRADVLSGFPVRQADVILCRNLLIYYGREEHFRVVEEFYKGLKPGGLLVLGRTEALPRDLRSRFEKVDLAERIYRKAGE